MAASFSAFADPPTLQELSSNLFTHTPILWQAPVSNLPKNLWSYRNNLPHIFSAEIISNAIVLGALQSKGFPKPSTNDTCIQCEDPCPCGCPCNFSIRPYFATLSYEKPHADWGSEEDIPSEPAIVKRAWECVSFLKLDPTQLIQKAPVSRVCSYDENGHDTTNNRICSRSAAGCSGVTQSE